MLQGAAQEGDGDPLQYGPNPGALMARGQSASGLANGHAGQDGLANGHGASKAEPSGERLHLCVSLKEA